MTIVAGFTYSDGIMLCADTQHTYPGVLKMPGNKIVSMESVNGSRVVFGLTGSVSYARMAIDDCCRAVASLKANNATIEAIVCAVREVLSDIYKDHIYVRPDWGTDACAANFQLLIGAYSRLDGMRLFETYDTSVYPVEPWHCVGCGSYLASSLIDGSYGMAMPLQSLASLAAYALRQTKRYVDGCGGNSEFIVLRRNGQISSLGTFDISQKEKLSDVLEELLGSVRISALNPDASDEDVSRKIDYLSTRVRAIRKEQRETRNNLDLLAKMLSKNASHSTRNASST